MSGAWVRGGPGTVRMLAAGSAHSVRVPNGTARVLMVTVGVPFDAFARELAALYTAGPADLRRVVEVAGRHGVWPAAAAPAA